MRLDLLFGQDFLEIVVELNGGLQIVAEWLFTMTRAHLPFSSFVIPAAPSCWTMVAKKRGATGEIEKIVAVAAVRFVDGFHLGLEALIRIGIGKIAGNEIDALDEPVPHLEVDGIGGELRDFGGQRLAEGLRGEIATGHADDGEMRGKTFSCARLSRAGSSLRLVRSPVAPKMTMAQAAAGLGASA